MLFVFGKNKIKFLIGFIVLISIFSVCVGAIYQSTQPVYEKTIVIDAGHGGIDGGAVGKTTGVAESYLNLQYALKLKSLCKQYGYKVVMTRNDMNGLYSPFAKNKKKSELTRRQSIIEKANPDLVVSIHMNSFSSNSSDGAQVFYADENESGKALAESVQNVLFKNVENSHKTAKVGDYYILNCTKSPGILIECGFLSNEKEELLLQQNEYIDKFCYNVLCGILLYFSF